MRYSDIWNDLTRELAPMMRSYRARIRDLDVETKPDKTYLTEADLAIERTIVELIQGHDSSSRFVTEEHTLAQDAASLDRSGRLWVIDPIDGTAEFLKAESREFCTAICVLEEGMPAASFVLAYELSGPGDSLVVTCENATQELVVNGTAVARAEGDAPGVSLTRSAGSPAEAYEKDFASKGYHIKSRTTSQTLDMLRTAVDLRPWVDNSPYFDLFIRSNQKIWDGLPGMSLGLSQGLTVADASGEPILPLLGLDLSVPEPTFPSSLMGAPGIVQWFTQLR